MLGRAWASDFVLFCLGVEADEITYCYAGIRYNGVLYSYAVMGSLMD